ncbi:MAG TPA: PLP-dependent aminotransferase family protein [Actinocrinis sp.]|uniref:MocR-like transcription factor YczR n=1 Tax=Actinocrinis sp. TaxID=1920516 RepID=UPI002DDD6F0E|nr:PLP-dependent aminotransferase family protein [Actinocrinis sp.]HEV3169713.1 PLP-dependent aminotransferase family protein [Actinocrinis sp.]
MSAVNGSLGAAHLAQQLGPWRGADGTARGKSLQTALAERITALVLDGRIAVGVRLPAERALSDAAAVSRTTVTAAYALLRESGFAVSRQGSGTYTALPDRTAAGLTGGWHDSVRGDHVIDLMCAAPMAPLPEVQAALRCAAEQLPAQTGIADFMPYGLDALREAIADRYCARGLPTSPDQILVTAGAQSAITLVGRLLLRPGDRVLVEGPSYPNALDTFRAVQARLVPVPLDGDGWVPGSFEDALGQLRPRLAYAIPHFQNPTGHLMDPDREASLARAARRAGSWLLADETVTDVALDVPAPAPFATAIRAVDSESVLVCGSMSKSFWGGLRIGWLRGPARIVHELAAARAALDLGSPLLDQLVAVAVLRGDEAHLERQRDRWREQRAMLMRTVDELFPAWTYRVPEGGLSLWVRMDREEATGLAHRAQTHGVLLHSGPRFGADAGTFERYIRLPYALPPETLVTAMHRIALARAVPGPWQAAEHRADLVA